jgi:hypothetical protein
MTSRLDKHAKFSIVDIHAVLLIVGVIGRALLLQVQMCKGLGGKAKRQVVLAAAAIRTCCCHGGEKNIAGDRRADGESGDDTEEQHFLL